MQTFGDVQSHLTSEFIVYLSMMIVMTVSILFAIQYLNSKAQLSRLAGLFLSIAYPLAAGMVGSFTALFAKIAINLITAPDGYTHISSYIFLVFVFPLGAFQIHLLNLGLNRYDQLLIVPVFAVSLELFTICAGLVFLEEFGTLNIWQKAFFPVAVFMTFFGVIVITKGQRKKQLETASGIQEQKCCSLLDF